MPEQETFQDLTFPIRGMDSSGEFGAQRPGTTVVGKNVRGQDPATRRLRGGSRSGLGKYIREQVDWETEDNEPFENVIQHLNIIVDPTVDALLANFESANGEDDGRNPGTFTDPSTNNLRRRSSEHLARKVREGGSGRQQRRRTPKPTLTITANNRTKDYGVAVTFVGSEFTASGLLAGDSLTSVSLYSRGSPAYAPPTPPGQYYRIIPSSAVLVSGSADPIGKKYRVRYVPGRMTVKGDTLAPYGLAIFWGAVGAGASVTFTAVLNGSTVGTFTGEELTNSECHLLSTKSSRFTAMRATHLGFAVYSETLVSGNGLGGAGFNSLRIVYVAESGWPVGIPSHLDATVWHWTRNGGVFANLFSVGLAPGSSMDQTLVV